MKTNQAKKLIRVLAFLLFSGVLVGPLYAEDAPTIVVIDNGANTALFKNNIVWEVCLLSSYKCPNGKLTMEGPGSANLPATTNKDFNHGTQMISIITRFNPTAKVIPIRIVGMNPNGNPSLYNLDDVTVALDWVIANRIKYNIAVVNLSQGKIFANCKVPTGMKDQIATLKAVNVAVIAAVGNDGDHTSVFSPACLTDTVSVGATDNPWPGSQGYEFDKKAPPYIARYSNGANGQVDFYLNARWNALQLNGSTKFTVGTSNSTALMSALWLANRKATFDETFNYFVSISTNAKNEFVNGRFIPAPDA